MCDWQTVFVCGSEYITVCLVVHCAINRVLAVDIQKYSFFSQIQIIYSDFRRRFISMAATKEMDEIKEFFDLFDKDKSGSIDIKEIEDLLVMLKYDKEAAKEQAQVLCI